MRKPAARLPPVALAKSPRPRNMGFLEVPISQNHEDIGISERLSLASAASSKAIKARFVFGVSICTMWPKSPKELCNEVFFSASRTQAALASGRRASA